MEQDAPKIEFPCSYPIKVLGRAGQDFETVINEIFEQHAPAFDRNLTQRRPSKAGTLLSLTLVIEATGPEQLEALHKDLMATGRVSMVI